jgi:hypothetical protein
MSIDISALGGVTAAVAEFLEVDDGVLVLAVHEGQVYIMGCTRADGPRRTSILKEAVKEAVSALVGAAAVDTPLGRITIGGEPKGPPS